MKKVAGIITNVIILIIALFYIMPMNYYVFFRNYRKNKVSHYTGVKLRGENSLLTLSKLNNLLTVQRNYLDLETDQSNVLLIHGRPDIAFQYESMTEVFTKEDLPSLVKGEGNYTVISCYNGFHDDYSYGGQRFVRDTNTISRYPTMALCAMGNLLVTTDEFTIEREYLLTPFLWRKISIKKMKEKINKLWETKDNSHIIKEEEVPEDIRNQI